MRSFPSRALALAIVSALIALPAFAAEGPPKAPPAAPKASAPEQKGNAAGHETQQARMKRCNATAREKQLKGDERRAFMSSCLRN